MKIDKNAEAKMDGNHDASKKMNNFRKFVRLCQFLHCYNRKLVGCKGVSATDEVRLDNSKILLKIKLRNVKTTLLATEETRSIYNEKDHILKALQVL